MKTALALLLLAITFMTVDAVQSAAARPRTLYKRKIPEDREAAKRR
jgi:hypothetical protein